MDSGVAAEPDRTVPPGDDNADVYEERHVYSVYKSIAGHFAATRYAPWPRVDSFLSSLPPYSIVADIGCGNGKYLLASAARRDLFAFGTDRCSGLVAIAASHEPVVRTCDVATADARHQPLRDGCMDAALSIAVVHHLSTETRRVQAWKEVVRLLRVGGKALVYVWALERPEPAPQPRHGNRGRKMLERRFEAQDMLVPWHFRTKKEGATSDKILGGTEKVFMRYYHVYSKGELESELSQLCNIDILESFYDHQNWCAIMQRSM